MCVKAAKYMGAWLNSEFSSSVTGSEHTGLSDSMWLLLDRLNPEKLSESSQKTHI